MARFNATALMNTCANILPETLAPILPESPRRNGSPTRLLPVADCAPAPPPHAAPGRPPDASGTRRLFFRCVRVALGAVLLSTTAAYLWNAHTTVMSDHAYINAEIIQLRAPMGGQLQLSGLAPGEMVPSGAAVFHLRDPRAGTPELTWPLLFASELVERLQAETAEAALRHTQQQRIFQYHDALRREQLIPALEFTQEETKLILAQAALTNKQTQLQQAQARRAELERQASRLKEAVVTMPFAGVVWAVRARNGEQAPAFETVLQVIDPKRVWVDAFVPEKHADKFNVGTPVVIRVLDSRESWQGRVASIRAGVGRIAYETSVAAPPLELARRRVAVRVTIESPNCFAASQFFGAGRSVVVSLAHHE